ncbi:MAG: Ferrochelatase [Bryobacterales bacterium]|nr:Ferrochelatase [Bryobacterales bacterium]
MDGNVSQPPTPITQAPQAILLIGFGGPEKSADVIPFLENVLRGRNVPRERMLEVAKHYYHFGGISPINQHMRELMAALEAELRERGPALPLYWGNRNWHPMLADTLGRMRSDGVRRAIAFVMSAYSSYSGCRQYLEDIARARETVGPAAPDIDKLRVFYNHPGFIEPVTEHVRGAFAQIPPERRGAAALVFTAHSVPVSMAATSRYEAQLTEACGLVAERLGRSEWRLAYQSRSGPPSQPWLGPDIGDYLRELHSTGTGDVVIAPIGFISDHMEVLYDLDTEARELCEQLGLHMVRAATVGNHPAFVSMIRELVLERMGELPPRWLGNHGPSHDVCEPDCCPAATRR